MPTSGRRLYDGGVYHITQRGNNKQKIFRGDKDYEKLLCFIKEYRLKYGFDVYNYCLMPNHIHLLVKVAKGADLPKIMQGIFQSFRFHYRKRYRYTGYLFQGRYKSKPVEKDSYMLECARYIERNPLRAGLVKDLSDYRWSSYLHYACGHEDGIITDNPMFTAFGHTQAERRRSYQRYVLEDRFYEHIIDKEFKITY